MRPLRLNSDCSAISKVLPQHGQSGRPNSSVAVRSAVFSAWQADRMLIVDSPRRTPSDPRFHPLTESYWARYVAPLRRLRETLVAAITLLQCRAVARMRIMHAGRRATAKGQ